jgi:hypothetical protein
VRSVRITVGGRADAFRMRMEEPGRLGADWVRCGVQLQRAWRLAADGGGGLLRRLFACWRLEGSLADAPSTPV